MNTVILKNGQSLMIRPVQKEDAPQMLAYLKTIGGESDYLLFGAEGVSMTREQEEAFLDQQSKNLAFPMFIGLIDGDIVSVINASGSNRSRVAHMAEIGISVLKAYWHQGIGQTMMMHLINHFRHYGIIQTVHLRVRTDHIHAIELYQKIGFSIVGTLHHHTKINDSYYDVYIMEYVLS